MKNPAQCLLWNKMDLTPLDLKLEMVEMFVREPHLERDLFKCKECGQLYFHEWYEHVNFKHDAFMYETYFPVETKEEIEALKNTKTSVEIMQFLPQLHGSFTNSKDETLHWLEKIEE